MYPPQWNKYKTRRIEYAGLSFASMSEAHMYDELVLLEKAKEIEILKIQDNVYLTEARILYKPDFCILDKKLNEIVWIEFKGFETDVWRIKRRLWMHYGPGKLRVYKKKGKKIFLSEEIIPKQSKQNCNEDCP